MDQPAAAAGSDELGVIGDSRESASGDDAAIQLGTGGLEERPQDTLCHGVGKRRLVGLVRNNARLVRGDLIAEVRRLARGSGRGLTILGSGSIVSQLAQEGLIDEYQILLNPVVIGKGKTVFAGAKDRIFGGRARPSATSP